MNIIEKSKFIDKAVMKTKNNELNWRTLTQNDILKPLPDEENSPLFQISKDPISKKDSYIADFNSGSLLLLVFISAAARVLTSPPNGCTISLRIQDEKSKYSIEIASSSINNSITSELIRLYNLIDKDSSSLNALIDDFLNS